MAIGLPITYDYELRSLGHTLVMNLKGKIQDKL